MFSPLFLFRLRRPGAVDPDVLDVAGLRRDSGNVKLLEIRDQLAVLALAGSAALA